MKILNNILTPILCLTAIFLLTLGAVYMHTKKEKAQPVASTAKDEFFIVEETNGVPESEDDEEAANVEEDNVYRYLAIGNSMTIHRVDDLWWGEWGMAASTRENDYVHVVQAGLNERFGATALSICSFIPWEQATNSSDRLMTLNEIEPYLNENLDLVTIQLGEGMTSYDDLTGDYEKLITYIQAHAPNAQIMVIGNFWANPDMDASKIEACNRCGATFIDLSPLTTDENVAIFRSSIGAQVWGDDGQLHTIENYTAGAHPNDAAMGWIATYILDAIKQ